MQLLRAFLQDRIAAAAAEFALVLPVVLTLILVTLEGGHYMYAEHKVTKGVRDGARYAGRQFFSAYSCPSAGPGTIDSAVVTKIKNITRTGYTSGANSVIGGWVDGDITVTVDCVAGQQGIYAAISNMAPIVKVNAIVTYPRLFALPGLATSSIKLRAEAEAAVMGL